MQASRTGKSRDQERRGERIMRQEKRVEKQRAG
jgi:hypothetical protein